MSRTPQVSLSLPAEAASVATARRFILEAKWSGTKEHADRLALLVSELATNAVLHARTEFSISVHSLGRKVRICVEDGNPSLPVAKDYGPTAATGRGIALVEALSSRWGVEQKAAGKIVWFELDERMA
jgi:anti-sigma regulatory factor (Ser/Thr protein kinase)